MTKKEIALNNLRLLGVQNACIEAFEKDENDVWWSLRAKLDEDENGNGIIIGLLYDTRLSCRFGNDVKESIEEVKKAIEKVKEDGYLPYHVIQTRFGFGNTFSVLYVPGDDAEEDLLKKEDFDRKYGYELCSYVHNADALDCSEYGYICIKGAGGGIIRTA